MQQPVNVTVGNWLCIIGLRHVKGCTRVASADALKTSAIGRTNQPLRSHRVLSPDS